MKTLFVLASVMVVLFLATPNKVEAQKKTPHFKDYPVTEIYKGKNAPLKLITRDDKRYRTRLSEASKEKPTFAGHYILTGWGCGTSCSFIAVIDANTGKVSYLPFVLIRRNWSGDRSPEFNSDSKLIIFFGSRGEVDEDNGAHYYKFENGRFVHLQSVLSKGRF